MNSLSKDHEEFPGLNYGNKVSLNFDIDKGDDILTVTITNHSATEK
jgi:hypothetical protein